MDQKTKVVIQEIKYWKKNKLLPEHYCDFLLALYTEGSENIPEEKTKLTFTKYKKVIRYFIIFTAAISAVIFLFFSNFMSQLQVPLPFILYGLGILLLLIGIRYKVFFIQCLSLLFIVLLTAWSTLPFLPEWGGYIIVEAAWIGGSLLFLALSRRLYKLNAKLCVTLYVNGIVLLFVPSFQAMYMDEFRLGVIQVVLVAKFFCTFVLIRKWHPIRLLLKGSE
ncbi:hypothetical protein [Bacillus horti]|uniref:DUF2157 domain-containing protein n=1 Tax=Caldalkalibacillus horti TaxID=77523 RepID=A0ABT9W4S0_9BACI|nr:hypothetical protein [Bacillus horti]MDQ0168064.1 hypothetical protein [Bacillus horti]